MGRPAVRSYPEGMGSRAVDVAGILAAGLLSAAVTVLSGGRFPEWLFITVLLSALWLAARLGRGAWRDAGREAARAHTLATADADEVARAAVKSERERLASDLDASLRACLAEIRTEADASRALADPVPAAERIHRLSRRASSDLRRQLGLLRTVEDGPEATESRRAPERIGRGDAAIALAAAAFATFETIAYSRLEGRPTDWASVVLTGAVALTVIWRRTSPGMGAYVASGLFVLGALTGVWVSGGFWWLVTVCGLLWTITSRARTRVPELGAGLVLIGCAAAHTWVTVPENAPLTVVLLVVSCGVGLVAHAGRSRAARAAAVARDRADELALAASMAVAEERCRFARDVHDLVSHSVGLIAMQAAAVQVTWRDNPASSRAALEVIAASARDALDELDRLPRDAGVRRRGTADLEALVGRVRSAGTPVTATWPHDLDGDAAGLVYRVVQETLTNVMRHAPGASARVEVRRTDDRLVVSVTDTGPGPAAGSPRGYGLVGLREQVALASGSLVTGAGPGGTGFAVEATLHAPKRVPA